MKAKTILSKMIMTTKSSSFVINTTKVLKYNTGYEILVDSKTNDSVKKPEYTYKHKWCFIPPETRELYVTLHPIFPISSGAKNQAVYAKLPLEVWLPLFSDELLEIVLRCPNQEIERYKKTENCANATFIGNLGMAKLKTFIGLF